MSPYREIPALPAEPAPPRPYYEHVFWTGMVCTLSVFGVWWWPMLSLMPVVGGVLMVTGTLMKNEWNEQ
jgi:hypothetical protein